MPRRGGLSKERAALGVDLGGTKIAAGLLIGERVVGFRERPTPREGGRAVVEAIVELARAVLRDRRAVVGVGTPGPLDYARGVVRFAPNVPGLSDFPLQRVLSERLGLPVVLENDANAAALAEHHLGAARGARSSLYLTVSTGIGGGMVVAGRVLRGAFGQAGEIGHLVVDPDGPLCACGSRGCLEALASGRALARDAAYVFGHAVDVPELFSLDEPRARALVAASARWVGRALASVQRVFDPEVVVLGGGVALGGGERYLRAVRRAYREAMVGWRPASVRRARLGRRVGVVVAALAALLEVGGVADRSGFPLGEDNAG